MNVEIWCDRVIRWGFTLLFILVPLVLTPWNYELFEYNKMMVTYALTGVIVAAWMVKMIAKGKFCIAKTPLDIPIVLFLSFQFVSSMFSMDPHVSWFGYYSRFNGGMWSIISYVLLYYAFVSNLSNWTSLLILLKIFLATAAVIGVYAALEHFGHSVSCLIFTQKFDVACWVQDVQNRVFATLGQPNWLAAYLTALIPLTWYFALQNQKYWSFRFWIWSLTAAFFFLVLLFTRSRSGLLGFTVADVVFWGLIFLTKIMPINRKSPHAKKVSSFPAKSMVFPFATLHAFFFLIVFFNGTYADSVDQWLTLRAWQQRFSQPTTDNRQPTTEITAPAYTAPLLEFGGTESGTIRKYVWQSAIAAWKSSVKTMAIGTGTETFAFAFFRYRPAGHNLTSEWDFLYNKAHNEYLNYLTTTGILGLGSYLLVIGAFIWWFVKKIIVNSQLLIVNKKNNTAQLPINNHQLTTINLALFSGWLSVLVTNFFGFSVVIVQLFFFLFPAFVLTLHRRHQSEKNGGVRYSLTLSGQIPKVFSLIIFLLVVAFLVVLARLWYADTLYAAGYRLSRAGQYGWAKPLAVRAINLNPGEPLYHDELGTILANQATAAVEMREASAAASLMRQALTESDRAITTSPQNVNFWKSRTKIFYTFSTVNPQFTAAAIQALGRARELSPYDPKILYNLAILYGRNDDTARAIELLNQTIDLKPNYRDAYFALHLFYKEMKNEQKAREVVQTYLRNVDPNDKDFQERLK